MREEPLIEKMALLNHLPSDWGVSVFREEHFFALHTGIVRTGVRCEHIKVQQAVANKKNK